MDKVNNKSKELLGIEFEVEMSGCGIVNYDSADHKYYLKKHCDTNLENVCNNNISLAKKNFYKKESIDETGKDVDYKIKISSTCLRHSIFSGREDADSAIWEFPETACNYISSPEGQLGGYLCTSIKGKDGTDFRKKSALTVTDAESLNAVSSFETFTKSGDKTENSFYVKEMTGNIKYSFNAYLSIKELQYLSLDKYFGRNGVSEDYIEGKNILEQSFKNRYGRVPYTKGVYSSNTEIFGNTYGEYGLKMDDEFINLLINKTINNLKNIRIQRSGAEAHTTSIKWRPIFNGLDKGDFESIPETIPTFTIHQFYTEASQHDWESRKEIFETRKTTQTEKKKKKEEEKKKKKEQKEITKGKK